MIKCVKSVVKFSASIVAGIGLVILCFGLYILYNQVGLDYSDLYYNSADWLRTLQEYGFIILGVLIFLIGCAGVYGSRKKKPACQKTCLTIYEIGALLFFVICTALAILTLIYSDTVFGSDCQGKDYFQDIDSQIQQADQLLCSNQCQCYITKETLFKREELFKGKNYTTEDVNEKIISVQTCPTFQVDEYAAAAKMMQAAETLLRCTGWCKSTSYYLFSDINDDIEDNLSCFQETKDFVESTGRVLGYVLLGLGLLFGLNIALVIFLCCCKEKKSQTDYLMYET